MKLRSLDEARNKWDKLKECCGEEVTAKVSAFQLLVQVLRKLGPVEAWVAGRLLSCSLAVCRHRQMYRVAQHIS